MRVPFRVVFEQRGETPRRLSLLVPLASVFAALFFGALFLIATGHSPIDTYSNMFQDGFASFNGITDTLALSTEHKRLLRFIAVSKPTRAIRSISDSV